MRTERAVFVKCSLSAGSIPAERTFHVPSNGGDLAGIAAIHYCYTPEKKRMKEGKIDGKIPGLVAGVEIEDLGERGAKVYLPDSEMYVIARVDVIPMEAPQRVPVEP